jgi:AraC-like DNA-binding protein
VAFGAEFDAIICPAVDMDRPMAAADTSMARYARSYVEALSARSSTIDGKVQELIIALLPTGRCSLDRVAQHLGCDGRTAQRRLAECGKSFSEILDAQRAEMVVRLIEDRNRSLPAVAELLGFLRAKRSCALVPRTLWLQHYGVAEASAAHLDGENGKLRYSGLQKAQASDHYRVSP